MRTQLTLILGLIIFASSTYAGVYKCTIWDKETKQNKVVYTDVQCAKSSKQTPTEIQVASSNKVSTRDIFSNNVRSDTVDQQVTRAVLNQDFKLAKSLAATKEHWRLIAIAEGESATPVTTVKTEQPLFVQTNQENACEEARGDFEKTSRLYWRDRDLVATKKSMMFAACGVPEPLQSQPILVGIPYGIGWVRPHYNHHRPNHHYTNGYEHQHNSVHNGGSLSLDYRSKQFGLQVNSARQNAASY
jgi:hypothetical protein